MYSLKIKWFRNYILYSDSKCFKLMAKLFDVDKMLNCGKIFSENICQRLSNTWKDVLKAYILYMDKVCIEHAKDFLHMPLFYNHNFVNGNYVCMLYITKGYVM